MNIPVKSEIDVHGSADEAVACKNFLGKTVAEAEALFQAASMTHQEDLMWMGPRAFAYYLPAALAYLRSEASAGDDSFVDALHNIFVFRLDEPEFALALGTVRDIQAYVIANIGKFAVDGDIYGDLLGRYQDLQSRLKG